MRFIHAADIHLGNSIKGIDRRINLDKNLKRKLSLATFDALEKIVDNAISLHVDFILFPGDIFDSNQQSAYLYNFLTKQFLRLKQAGIEAYLSFGNHDFLSDSDNDFIWPDNVHVFPKNEAKVFYYDSLDGKRIAITGTSYAQRNPGSSLLDLYPQRISNVDYQIGLYHGSVKDGSQNSYAPFDLNDMKALHYDYWALGHIHVRSLLSKDPLIAYSGDPQGLDLTEEGQKGVYLISDDENRTLNMRFLPIGNFVFNKIVINAESQNSFELLTHRLVERLSQKNNDGFSLFTVQLNFSQVVSDKLRDQLTDPSFLDIINDQIISTNNLVIKIQVQSPLSMDEFSDLDQKYWQQAKNEIFDSGEFVDAIRKRFGQDSQFVIDYFSDNETHKELIKQAQELISRRSN
ncbi:exonuclease SbcCD subunit D [Oenococcus alcoholitolerans]|uniref:metallophosphoesterase family protein n=1 Tax=Oenococcus alcoholitolerans TaxID=931074 RepID=UPI003F6E5728